jgi:type VI secretion system protein ImpA
MNTKLAAKPVLVPEILHLDVDNLLRPRPSGAEEPEAFSMELRQELERARKTPASADRSKGPRQVPPSAWEEIVLKTASRLTEGSRDLGLAVRLTEAITKLHGFAGLRDGLYLMRRLVEDCWGELTPRPRAEGDLSPLLGPLKWIDDPDRGALFPHTVRAVPLAKHGDRSYAWIDWKRLKDRGDKAAWSSFERAVHATPRLEWEHAADLLDQSHDELERLTVSVSAHSIEPFEMAGLWRALDDCRMLVGHILEQVPAIEANVNAEVNSIDAEVADQWEGEEDDLGYAHTQLRARIYAQIEHLALALQRVEPHSPVPHLLLRAVQLGTLPFPQLMSELLRDQNVLGRMNQELGIRPNP